MRSDNALREKGGRRRSGGRSSPLIETLSLFFFSFNVAGPVLNADILVNNFTMVATHADGGSCAASKISATPPLSTFAPTVKERRRHGYRWLRTYGWAQTQGLLLLLLHQPPQLKINPSLLLNAHFRRLAPRPLLISPHPPCCEPAGQHPCATHQPHNHPAGSQPPVRAPRRVPYDENNCSGKEDGAGVESHDERGENIFPGATPRGFLLEDGAVGSRAEGGARGTIDERIRIGGDSGILGRDSRGEIGRVGLLMVVVEESGVAEWVLNGVQMIVRGQG